MPKVSVIMPAYNAQSFIAIAIESVLNQSLKDWELIIVNDGSSDSTSQILEKYVSNNVKVIHQENCGEAAARNVGLDAAHAEYIAFLDADDFYYPNALEDFVSFLDNHNEYDVVYSDGILCDQSGKTLVKLSDVRPSVDSGNLLESLVLGSYMVTCCMMVRASKITSHSIRFDQNLTIGPDWDFWIQLAVHVQFGYLPSITAGYRIHNTNISKTINSNKRKKDRIFGRLKVMNSEWFNTLSTSVRELFFIDLLERVEWEDTDTQMSILTSDQFSKLPEYVRAKLWRMVGIQVLEVSHDKKAVNHFFVESLKLNPYDRKTRFIIWSLGLGHSFALIFIHVWHRTLLLIKKLTSPRSPQSKSLQKIFGFR